MNEEFFKWQEDFLNKTKEETNQNVDILNNNFDVAAKEQARILEERTKSLETTFASVVDEIRKLEENANNLFDLNVVNAVNARARNLAAKGIITNAQAASATGFLLADYKANAELKRTEIMTKVNEQMINALNEKQKALDTIMKDSMATEQRKAQAADRITQLYNWILEWYANQWVWANQAINTNINNAYAQVAQIDVAEKIKETEFELQNNFDAQTRAELDTNADKRLDYVMTKINEQDPNMSRYAAYYLQNYIQNGQFMTMGLTDLLAQVMRDSATALAIDVGSKSVPWGVQPTINLWQPTWWQPAWTPTGQQPTLSQEQQQAQDVAQQATTEWATNLIQQTGVTWMQTPQYPNTTMSSAESPVNVDNSLLGKLKWRAENNPYTAWWAAIGSLILPIWWTAIWWWIWAWIDYLTK